MTQVAAAQCLVASIEFWRSTESELVNTSYPLSPLGWAMLGDNAGVLYWQADDTWPGPSWSTIELGGRLKVGPLPTARCPLPTRCPLPAAARANRLPAARCPLLARCLLLAARRACDRKRCAQIRRRICIL